MAWTPTTRLVCTEAGRATRNTPGSATATGSLTDGSGAPAFAHAPNRACTALSAAAIVMSPVMAIAA